MSTITFAYRVIDSLPEQWVNADAWPAPGAYRVADRWCGKDLYFVTEYTVEIAFDAFKIGTLAESYDPEYDIPEDRIRPSAIALTEFLLNKVKGKPND
ncbi:MAG: hypothetical protein ACOYBW_08770 [Fluviibacter phosphoraccumulans]